jgi:RHS repeat-associated protein
MAYDAASQLAAGKYDGEGRLTSDSQRSYTWDMASRLISYSGAGGSASFSYDANGMMLSQSGSGGTRQYVANYVFGLPAVAIVRDGNSQDLRYYVPLPGGASLYSMEASGGARHFFHYDEAGNTTFLTDDTGAVTDSYGITPYGESVVHTGASDNPFTFQGAAGAMQVESALYYMRARFYDGGSGRFISRDLVTRNTLPLRINPYQYAEGNPLTKFDPSGADATTQLLDQQFGTRSQWDTFQTQIAQYYVGQQVVQQVIQQAFADAAAQNGAWWNFWATPVDPAALAASRLQALLGNSFSIGDGFSDLPYITQLYNATNSGDLNGMAQAFNSLLGTSATTLIGQDAEALVAQANGVTLLGGNNSGTSLPPDAQHWINQALAGVVSNDGGSVVSHDGGTVVSNDGGSFANLLMGVVSHDGGTVVSHDGGTVVSHDGGTVVSHDGGTLFGNGGSTFSFRIGN